MQVLMNKTNFSVRIQAKCLKCGTTKEKHHAKGLCRKCYAALWWKEKQGVHK